MKISGTLIFLFLSVFLSAQEKWPTANGDLIINPIQHASMVWEWNGLTIYIDPVGDSSSYSSFSEPDLIFITHSHGDHLSNKTLENIHAKNAIFIVPNEVADKLDVKFKNQLHTMQNGDDLNVLGISIRCVPAYNYPVTSESRHLKGVGNGYVISIGGKRAYVSGDTGNMPEMNSIKDIDFAFLSMNLPYTMDVDEAALATKLIQPKVIYPYHYRGQGGYSDLIKFKALLKEESPKIEVRILEWYSK